MKIEVSVIIPVFNRGHLIIDTLRSIQRQDFPYWECILIDDDSSDNSGEVITNFIKDDKRFRMFRRPENLPKGANSCRNFGLELSLGIYVQWFDSDDIMVINHLSALINALKKGDADFVIGDSVNFIAGKGVTGKPYRFDRENAVINASNFGRHKIGWITNDFLCKKNIIGTLRFNEQLKTDGDEYNFFTQLLHVNNNGKFVNEVLSYRRLHSQTLSNTENLSTIDYWKKIAAIKFFTCKDILKYKDSELIKWFLSGYMHICYKISLKKKVPPFFVDSLRIIYSIYGGSKALKYLFAIGSAWTVGRGYRFLKDAS